MDIRRYKDIFDYGQDCASKAQDELSKEGNKKSKLSIFLDILYCGFKYRMLSSEYMKEKMYSLPKDTRIVIGGKYLEDGKTKDIWQHDFQDNRKFIAKWSQPQYEVGLRRIFRRKAYTKRYNAGVDLKVEDNVYISRHHFLNGEIRIGSHVYLAKNTSIDYSGGLIIKDNVRITNGVIIETHRHLYHSDWKLDFDELEANKLIIEEGAIIGVKSVILPTCHYIGKFSRVGAGSIVTKDVPDYAIVMGVPAKVVKIMDH